MAEPGPRFPLPGEQDPVAGVEVGGEAGLRLKVGAWLGEWLCRETGATIGQEGEERNFKLVLAEPLTEGGSGHVDKYPAPAPAPLQHSHAHHGHELGQSFASIKQEPRPLPQQIGLVST